MDLIILILLVDYIGKQARRKGMNVLKWRSRLAFGCLAADLALIFISMMLTQNLYTAIISGYLGATLIALMIFQSFKKEAMFIASKNEENSDS